MSKRRFGREVWERACEVARKADPLPTYKCGPWTIEKLFFVCQYLAQTTQAMVGNPNFASINYVDLFCGSGVCEVSKGMATKRFPGSALLAACCTKPFSRLLLADASAANVEAIRNRIVAAGFGSLVQTWVGDANVVCADVAKAIPHRSLTIAFLDPYSLDIRFEAVQRLAQHRPLDLLILFADAMDIVRNVEKDYFPGVSDKLDQFLGTLEWRSDWAQLQNRDGANVRSMFARVYLRQLARIGYSHSRTRVILGDTGPLYRLVYASKHPLGLKFWDIAESEDLHGNKSLFGV